MSIVRVRSESNRVGRSTQSSNSWDDLEYAAAGSITAAPALYCLFLGIFGALGANTFPILESAIAIWLLGDWLDGRRDLGPRSEKILRGSEDLEGRIYSYLNVLRSGHEGLFGMLVVVTGFSISVRLLQMGLAPGQVTHLEMLLVEVWQLSVAGAALQVFFAPIEQLSWTVIPVAVGLFNLWYWYRLLQRLSYAVNSGGDEADAPGAERLVRRPELGIFVIGWMLFVLTQSSAIFAVARWLDPTGGPDALGGEVLGIEVAFAIWPALFVLWVVLLLFELSRTNRVYGMTRTDAVPFFELSRETVSRDRPQLGMQTAEDSAEPISESAVRIVSIEVAIVGYIGLNALLLPFGSIGGGVLRSVSPAGNTRLEVATSVASLGWQSLLIYLYVGLGFVLLSVSIDRLNIYQEAGSDKILRLTNSSLANGYRDPVFRKILWILFAELCIAIIVIQVAFQAPLPLYAMLIGGPFALLLIPIFSFCVCAVASRLYDAFVPGSLAFKG